MISRLTLTKIALVVGSLAAFYFGMTWAKSLQDPSTPPDVYDLALCERARLNARKIEAGQSDFDTREHRWTIDGCEARGFNVK